MQCMYVGGNDMYRAEIVALSKFFKLVRESKMKNVYTVRTQTTCIKKLHPSSTFSGEKIC